MVPVVAVVQGYKIADALAATHRETPLHNTSVVSDVLDVDFVRTANGVNAVFCNIEGVNVLKINGQGDSGNLSREVKWPDGWQVPGEGRHHIRAIEIAFNGATELIPNADTKYEKVAT